MTPEYGFDPSKWVTDSGRKEVILGTNHDNTVTVLPEYVDLDGVHVHPSRVEGYLAERQEWEKKE